MTRKERKAEKKREQLEAALARRDANWAAWQTPENIATVRAGLSEQDNEENSDADICRFIRATKGNLEEAVERLTTTSLWRREQGCLNKKVPIMIPFGIAP